MRIKVWMFRDPFWCNVLWLLCNSRVMCVAMFLMGRFWPLHIICSAFSQKVVQNLSHDGLQQSFTHTVYPPPPPTEVACCLLTRDWVLEQGRVWWDSREWGLVSQEQDQSWGWKLCLLGLEKEDQTGGRKLGPSWVGKISDHDMRALPVKACWTPTVPYLRLRFQAVRRKRVSDESRE